MKVATKDGKSLMVNVSQLISLIATTEDAKLGLMENVLNVQRDGFSMKMEFVLQSVIYATLGVMMESVIAVIKVMLYQKENVSGILICLYQLQTAYVQNG